jgi:transcriptional regulator with XRE-family HTH domain
MEVNERLRAAIFSAGLSIDDVAERLDVDRKTVDRWVSGQRPYKRNQHAVAKLLALDPAYLWPAESADQASALAGAELVSIWPARSLVPVQQWIELFAHARLRIDVLVYAGFWLSEEPAVRDVLADRAAAGVQLRFLVGDPSSAAVALRSEEEGIDGVIPGKITNVLHNYRELTRHPAARFRLHATTLYNSIYRADDEMLVNTHVYGLPGHMTPLMYLRRVPGAELFASYLNSFERVWEESYPIPDTPPARRRGETAVTTP